MVRVSTGLWAGAVGLGVIAAAAIGVRAQGLVTINLLRFASHSRLLTWPNWRRRNDAGISHPAFFIASGMLRSPARTGKCRSAEES